MPLDLTRTGGEDVEMDVAGRSPQHSVLVPVRLADPDRVPERLEIGHVGRLVGGVRHRQADVDDGLGCETDDGRRADVLDHERPVSERGVDLLPFDREALRPRRVVLPENDGHRPAPADEPAPFDRRQAAAAPGARGWR